MKNDLRPEHLNQEVTVVLPLSVVLRIADEPKPAAPIAQGVARALPAIGDDYEGGKFAGVSLDGEQLVMLVLLPVEAEKVNHDQALEWAEKQSGVLPSRHDQLVLFKNLKSEFKDAYYWSGDLAADAGYAWDQGFSNGDQYWLAVGGRGRARAVRRIPIR